MMVTLRVRSDQNSELPGPSSTSLLETTLSRGWLSRYGLGGADRARPEPTGGEFGVELAPEPEWVQTLIERLEVLAGCRRQHARGVDRASGRGRRRGARGPRRDSSSQASARVKRS